MKRLFLITVLFVASCTKDTLEPPRKKYAVILDFDGYQFMWHNAVTNTYELTTIPRSMLTDPQDQYIFDKVTKDFAEFDLLITRDEAVFDTYPDTMRQRMIICDDYTRLSEYRLPFGGPVYKTLKGSATRGSMFLKVDKPFAIVFTKKMGYNSLHTGKAVTHEIGHTIGLGHQYLNGDAFMDDIMGNYASAAWVAGINDDKVYQDDKTFITQKLK